MLLSRNRPFEAGAGAGKNRRSRSWKEQAAPALTPAQIQPYVLEKTENVMKNYLTILTFQSLKLIFLVPFQMKKLKKGTDMEINYVW